MPELPEVEHLRRTLAPHLCGAKVTSVTLHRRDFVERCSSGRRRISPAELLEGFSIVELLRHGKNLALVSREGPAIGIHLGMSGMLRLVEGELRGESLDHVHCEWLLQTPHGRVTVLFRDPRRFGGIWTFDSLADLRRLHWKDLGPDALGVVADDLATRFGKTSRGLKSVLLDQAVLAGVGNIYADEALFAAKLHPLKPANSLKSIEIRRLTNAITGVLEAAMNHGGSTIRSYVDANGNAGQGTSIHRVYDRAGHPCPNCAKPLRNIRVCQRTTTYCTRCQSR